MTQNFRDRGIDSPRLDADLLVCEVLGLTRMALYLDLKRPLSAAELGRLRELVGRRRKREPLAYILGHKEFWGRTFKVSAAVLVPRPDTEALVERALALMPEGAKLRVLDLATGSGAIGLTLAAERPEASVVLTDLSPDALEVARANAVELGVAERVSFRQGDLLSVLEEDERYDLIVSNPPYISASELVTLEPEVREHEPSMALLAADEGYAIIDRLIASIGAHLVSAGTFLMEVGDGQAEEVLRRASRQGQFPIATLHSDLGGILRVVELSARPRQEPDAVEEVMTLDEAEIVVRNDVDTVVVPEPDEAAAESLDEDTVPSDSNLTSAESTSDLRDPSD